MIVPAWKAPKTVKAFASTRYDGYSVGPYQGLNLGQHVGDDVETVQRNRSRFAELAMLPSPPVWLNQTHSTAMIELSKPAHEIPDADGSYSQIAGVVCTVMTADCLPILLTDTAGSQVAAVHAGWRGLANGIVEKAVHTFNGNVLAWLGPAIGHNSFEVGHDVRETFLSHDGQAEKAFVSRGSNGKWLADMQLLAKQRLSDVGVTNVTSSNMCTYQDSERFYSYRRDGVTGRQASCIWIDS
ncbi:peptidoglycan editing factor PgeF [Vibrio profundum]|uniref:peptidoglycan editing factor PgeF n=1 Tax=Vibrio profundum TaxID=2910247 RepID=UPI003D0F8583